MKNDVAIDLRKMFFFLLKRLWLPVICGVAAFMVLFWQGNTNRVATYTASATMYVYNGNANMVNYGYVSQADLNTAVQLIDTYTIVVKSNKVMDAVAERLAPSYPGIAPEFIASSIYMESVRETGVVRVSCNTLDAQMSADICNAVVDVAPAEIIRVVGAGDIQIIDYATPPEFPNPSSPMRRAVLGGLVAVAVALGVLLLLFLLYHKVNDMQELKDRYTPPILASIRRLAGSERNPDQYRLSEQSSMDIVEDYAKLRTNLLYAIPENESRIVAVTSSVAGEGKSTIAANLAISLAMSGKRVILVDGDLRRACQREVFQFDDKAPGLTDVLVSNSAWREVLIGTKWETLRIMPAGHTAPNPGKLLGSGLVRDLLADMLTQADLVIIDTPPVNVVTDALILSEFTAGSVFVVRQDFSDHREIKRALISAEMAGMNVLGFVFYGTKPDQSGHYSRRRYKNYYRRYDSRSADDGDSKRGSRVEGGAK